jgi:hypothetical protein
MANLAESIEERAVGDRASDITLALADLKSCTRHTLAAISLLRDL